MSTSSYLRSPARANFARRQIQRNRLFSLPFQSLEGSDQKHTLMWAFTCEVPGHGKTGRWRERRAADHPVLLMWMPTRAAGSRVVGK